VHVTNRAVVADLDLGPVVVPAGWEILIPEYVLLRSSRYFERPSEFLPHRWTDHSPLRLERRAYFPFLTGPKFWVGSHFALLEATEAVGRFLDLGLDKAGFYGRQYPAPLVDALKQREGLGLQSVG